MKKTHGMSLTEILFIFAIGAVIIFAALRYFGISSTSIRVEHAIRQVHALTKISYQWLASQNQDDFTNTDGGKLISVEQLKKDGFLRKNSKIKDPWRGDISIAPGSEPNRIRITLKQIPQNDCKVLSKHLDSNSKITMPSCTKKLNNYTGEF